MDISTIKQDILQQLQNVEVLKDLEQFHSEHLGKKWTIPGLYKSMKDVPWPEKKDYAQSVQELQQAVESAFASKQYSLKQAQREEKLSQDLVDFSLPWKPINKWHLSLLAQERRRIEEIFQGMGFAIEDGNHVVSVYDNFESVNIPATHPATEMHDTIYLDQKDEHWRRKLLRTHTSAQQNELIKKYGTPCRFVVPGNVYRNEKLDATHDSMFWQVEWVVIDRDISIWHFKYVIRQILAALLEDDTIEVRMRPWYFPFVEPGFEIDAKPSGSNKWIEILWAGMIHPEVLKQANVDPNERSGFAFGLGLTRMVAIKHGLKDIRLLTNGDLRFARS